MAISQMRYRYGASVDDILAYPSVGMEFDTLCQKIRPGFTPVQYRLAALHIRKSRYCQEKDRTLFDELDASAADKLLSKEDTLDRIKPQQFAGEEGIVGIVEEAKRDRFIYLSETKNISELVGPFANEKTLKSVGNAFWTPILSAMRVYIYRIAAHYLAATRALWAKRLIFTKSPVFNQPIQMHD
jgi:hypothetical protein